MTEHEAFEEAKRYEKTAVAHGSPFTWSDNESLDELSRPERVAQIEDDARKVREQFDNRSTSKREEADKKREDLVAANAKLNEQFAAEEKEINAEYAAVQLGEVLSCDPVVRIA